LIESDSPIPDFLEKYKPGNNEPLFDDDKSDDEAEDATAEGDAGGEGNGWGSAEPGPDEPVAESSGGGWGTSDDASAPVETKKEVAAESGWDADVSW